MKDFRKYSILFFVIGLILTGCEKSDSSGKSEFTDAQIEQAYQEIKVTADSVLLSDDPIGGFNALSKEYRKMKEVKNVEVKENGMFIKLENDELVGWYIPPIPASDELMSENSISSVANNITVTNAFRQSPGNTQKYALLLNQQSTETDRPWNNYFLENLKSRFSEAGWNCYQLNAPDITVDYLRGIDISNKGGKSLADYDAIYYIAHGFFADNKPWILSGEDIGNVNKAEPELVCRVNYLESDIKDGSISNSPSQRYAFSGDFIRKYYKQGDFSGACIYMVACQSMGCDGNVNYSMAQSFTDYGGADVYVGWDESNYSGQESGYYLYKELLNGKTLDEAFKILKDFPAVKRYDYSNGVDVTWLLEHKDLTDDFSYFSLNNTNTATLRYYPSSASSFRLVEQPPVDDEGLTPDVHNIIPDDILENFKDLGIEINGGNNPPNIEGIYFVSPDILVKSNFSDGFSPGYKFADMLITFSEQDNTKLTVVCDYINGPQIGSGLGSFVTGNGNKFSVFTEVTGTMSSYPFKSVEIYSGEITSSGIKNFYSALMITEEAPGTIKRGQGRLIYDSDGFSEKTTQSNVASLRSTRNSSSEVSVVSSLQSNN